MATTTEMPREVRDRRHGLPPASILSIIESSKAERERLDDVINTSVLAAAEAGIPNAEIGRRLGVTGEAVRQLIARVRRSVGKESTLSFANDPESGRLTFSTGRSVSAEEVADLLDDE
ncbi:MAG: hypothetical protein LBB58_00060 [Cellulomonadaceae bacterium]|jgi:hypothetical protein|nr:hypothetical protein [Cellulomonadaceae bacterium]